LKNTLEPY